MFWRPLLIPNKCVIDVRRFLETTLYKYIQTCTDYCSVHRTFLYVYTVYTFIYIYTYKFTHQTHHAFFVLVNAFFVWLAFQETECGMHTHLTRLRAAKRQVSCGFTSWLPWWKLWFSGIHQTFLKILLLEELLANHLGCIKLVNRLGQGTYSHCGTWSVWTIFEAMNHAAVYIAKIVHELADVTWCWVNSLI